MNPYMKKKSSSRMKMASGGEAKKKKTTSTDVILKVLKPVNEVAKFVNKNITDKFLNDSGKKDSRQEATETYGKNRKRWRDKQIKEAGG